jgi:1,4-dihydroxy-2-naphthoate octaprenyltransferase
VTAGGLIDPPAVKRAMYLTFTLAVLVGVTLVWVGGVPILIIGILSVGSGIAYTGGPYPLGYHGLGDVFVFVFFGLIAVTGTYYVQAAALTAGTFPLWIPAETVSLTALVASLPIAALSTNILVVNNVRDRDEDATTGKRTLAVRYGYTFARAEFIILTILAYSVPLWFLSHPAYTLAVGIPLVTVPIALVITHTICTETAGDVLNPTLERVGKLLAGYALLFSIGLAIETLPVI